jgi:hypothetical protein
MGSPRFATTKLASGVLLNTGNLESIVGEENNV